MALAFRTEIWFVAWGEAAVAAASAGGAAAAGVAW